ncbi:hypothetical protein Bca4012_026930 [Brassica carinata]
MKRSRRRWTHDESEAPESPPLYFMEQEQMDLMEKKVEELDGTGADGLDGGGGRGVNGGVREQGRWRRRIRFFF